MYYSKEAEGRAQQQRLLLALFVMALGAGAGAVLALLFAPKTGEQTRRELATNTNKAVENLQHEVDRLRGELENRVRSN
jgi:gas vesicle protein